MTVHGIYRQFLQFKRPRAKKSMFVQTHVMPMCLYWQALLSGRTRFFVTWSFCLEHNTSQLLY